jgi:hypothetical protein
MPNEQAPFRDAGDGGVPWQPPEGTVPGMAGGPPPQVPPWPPQGTPPPGPVQGWWPQPVPPPSSARRGRARAVVTTSAVALAAALIAGVLGYEIGIQHSRISSIAENFKAVAGGACPAGETAPDPSATSPAGAALMARLLPIPAYASQVTALKQGVLSLRDYLNELYTGNATEQQRLTDRCFQTAVHRTWQTPDGTVTSVWLIQFGTAADARSYTLAVEQADAADPVNTDKLTVAGVSDGMVLGQQTLDKYGDTYTHVLGDAGNTSVIIHVFAPARPDNAAAARVLRDQTARLGAVASLSLNRSSSRVQGCGTRCSADSPSAISR